MNKVDTLKEIWRHLDEACGHLDEAFIEMSKLKHYGLDVEREINTIDFDAIVSLKNKIEKEIELEVYISENLKTIKKP